MKFGKIVGVMLAGLIGFGGVFTSGAVSINAEESSYDVNIKIDLNEDIMYWDSKDPSMLDDIEIKLYKLNYDRYYYLYQEWRNWRSYNETLNELIEEAEYIGAMNASVEDHPYDLSDGDYFVTVNESMITGSRVGIGDSNKYNIPHSYFRVANNGNEIRILDLYPSEDNYEMYKEGVAQISKDINLKIRSMDLLVKYIDPDICITDSSGNNLKCDIEIYKDNNGNLEKNLTTADRQDHYIYWVQKYAQDYAQNHGFDASGAYTAALEYPGTNIIRCQKPPYGYKKFDDVKLMLEKSYYSGEIRLVGDNVNYDSDVGHQSLESDNEKVTIYYPDGVYYRMGTPVIINIELKKADNGGVVLKNDTQEIQTVDVSFNYEEITGTYGKGNQGDVVFDKGKATIDIDPGESIVVDNIAEGTEYTVSANGCDVTGEKGTIKAGKNGEAIIKKGEETGDLTLLFNIPNLGNKEYRFNISIGNSLLNKDTITGKYGDVVFKDGIGEVVYTNQKATNIKGLPAGLGYKITNEELNISETGTINKNDKKEVRLKKVFNPKTDFWKDQNYNADRLDRHTANDIVDEIKNKYGLNIDNKDKTLLVNHISKGFHLLSFIPPLALANETYTYNGQCYGLSLTGLLNYIGFTTLQLNHSFPVNEDNKVEEKNHDEITKEILFWHCTQWLNRVKDKENSFKDKDVYADNLLKLLSDLRDGIPTLLGFNFSKESGGHVVFAYGHEDSNTASTGISNKILIADSNTPVHEYSRISYSTDPWEFTSDFYTGTMKWGNLIAPYGINDIDTLTLKNNYSGDFGYIRLISSEDSIIKDLSNNNEWVASPRKGTVEGNPQLNVIYDSDISDNNSNIFTPLNIILNQYLAPHSIVSKSGERYAFSEYISYKDIFISADAESALGAEFDQKGRVHLIDNSGQFELIIADNRPVDGEFNTYTVTGTAENSGDITVTLTDVGVRVEGDNIAGVQIEAEENDIVDTKIIGVNGAVEYGRKSDELIIFFDEEKDINAYETNLSETKYVYDGKSHVPEITIKHNGKLLVDGTDYSVTLPEDTINVGKKEITVTGINDYSGTFKLEYEIVDGSTSTPHTGKNTSNNSEVKTVARNNASSTKSSGTSAVTTGDSNYTALWISLSAAAAAAAIAAGVVYTRKRKSE